MSDAVHADNPAPQSRPPFVSLDELGAMVRPGDRLGVGGFHFSRLPLALVRSAIRAGARDLDYVSWGGGLALELLLAANAIRAMKLCFDSLDVFGLAPRFRQAVERGEIPLQDWTALGMMQGFHAAQFGLPSLPFPPPLGSELIERAGFARMTTDPIAGTPVAAAPALPLDVFLLHAQRADADGNVEIQGARGLDLSCIFAARKVLVTVEERVPAGAFRHAAPRAFIVPRSFVTAVADVPYGAWPTSCLPYYPTDYMALQQSIEGETLEIAPPDEHRRQWLGAAAALPPERVTAPALLRRRRDELESGPATVAEVMIDWIARTIDNASICSVGSVSPLATVAYLLAKRTHAPDLLLMTSNGGLIDVAPRPMVMTLAEPLDFQTAALHCGGDESYHWWYQRGRVTHEVVSAAQIDRWGATNNIQVTSPSGRTIRLPGQGGMADVANMHRHFLLYLPRQSPLSLVERVSYVSAARGLLDPAARTAAGYQPGDVRLITNLGAFELNPERREFELTSVHPGGTVDDVQAATGFPLRISPKLCETPAPSAETLRLIREEIDPLGIRRLEFVAGKERGPLLTALIESENAAIGDLIGAAGSGGGEHG